MTGSALSVRKEFAEAKRPPGGFPAVKLTVEENKKYQTAQAYLLIHCPFWADLLMSRLSLVPTRAVPIAATDGYAVYINPDTFFKYSVRKQAFIIAHEVMHCVFNDCGMIHTWKKTNKVICPGGTYPYSHVLMNVAADYVINALLIDADVGEYDPNWLFDPAMSEKGLESCVVVYEKLFKEAKKRGGKDPGDEDGDGEPGGGGNSPGNDEPHGRGRQKGFDKHLKPGEGQGKDPEEAQQGRNEAEWRVGVAAAAQNAKAQGKLPAAMDRFVGELLEPKVSWQDRIKSQMQRRLGMDGYDWTQLDKQFLARPDPWSPMGFPEQTSFRCGHIVVGVDTSGSIGDAEISRFFAEMSGIVADLQPRTLTVLWCDAKVGRHDELEEPEDLSAFHVQVNREGTKGGGGTSFIPVFEEASKLFEEPELLVYLTDLYGTFPKVAPPYPVVWGCISPCEDVPFGDVIKVDL